MDPLDAVIEDIDGEVSNKREWLSGGNARTYDDYQKICGEIRGLLYVRGYITGLKKQMEESE
jgi:hypothetical protein